MASKKTEHLELNDWVGTDAIRREELNGNFRKIDSEIKNHADQLDVVQSGLAETVPYIDKSKENLALSNIHKLINSARNKEISNATYIVVGDSTRASYGAWIYNLIKKKLTDFNFNVFLSAQSGLKAEHWGETTPNMQPGYPKTSDIIPLIPNDGATTVVDICLGINDIQTRTPQQVIAYIEKGIGIIKASKPNVQIVLTSPNVRADLTTYATTKEVYDYLVNTYNYAYINVLENVWKSWDEATNGGFMLDTTHPNEMGQRRMSEYILSKIVPSYVTDTVPQSIFDLKGTTEVYVGSKKARVSASIKLTKGTASGLMLKKLSNGKWYIFNGGEGNSASTEITSGGLNFLLDGYSDTTLVNAYVYIENLDVLNELPTNSVISLNHCVVDSFESRVSSAVLYNDLFPTKIRKLKGTVDQTGYNYNMFKDLGLKIEFKQTAGTSIPELYIGRIGTTLYLFTTEVGGSAISTAVNGGQKGYTKLQKSPWDASALSFDCWIYVSNPSAFANITDGYRVKLKDAIVTTITEETSILDYLMT